MTTTATQIHHVKTLARFRRVNKQLSAWDTLDNSELLPRELDTPQLIRDQLLSLQAELIACLRKLEERYARG